MEWPSAYGRDCPDSVGTGNLAAMSPFRRLMAAGLLGFLCFPLLLVGAYRPDPEFRPKLQLGGLVTAMVALPDGRLLVGGNFTTVDGRAAYGFARLLPDGALDPEFRPAVEGLVSAMAVLPADGRLLVAAYSTNSQTQLLRLHPDGRLDATFRNDLWIDSEVSELVVDSAGRVLVGGTFRSVRSSRGVKQARGFVRLLPDGTLDSDFNPRAGYGEGSGDFVGAIATSVDGRIYVGGRFSTFGGQSRTNLVRLLEDGSLDASFDVSTGADSHVRQIEILPDGRLLICGYFGSINLLERPGIVRLNTNGIVDPDFVPDLPPESSVTAMRPMPDGGCIVASAFYSRPFPLIPQLSFRMLRIDPNGRASAWGEQGLTSTGIQSGISRIISVPGGGHAVSGRDLFSGVDGRDVGALAVLDEAGRLRTGFSHAFMRPGAPRRLVQAQDRKLYVEGDFDRVDGQRFGTIARLHPDGVRDVSFKTDISGHILCMKPISGGRLLVAGYLWDDNHSMVPAVACLDPTGGRIFLRELTGLPRASAEDRLGRLIVVGEPSHLVSGSGPLFVRLRADGSIDEGFAPTFRNPPRLLLAVDVQSDGRIVVGGSRDGFPSGILQRFETSGREDPDFGPVPEIDGYVLSLAVDSEDRVLAGGAFTRWGIQSRIGMGRLLRDGTEDRGFWSSASDFVSRIELRQNGGATVAGPSSAPWSNAVRRILPNGSFDPDFVFELPESELVDLRDMASRFEEEVYVIRDGSVENQVSTLLRLIPAGPRLGIRRAGPGEALTATVSLPPGRERKVFVESSADLRSWTPLAEMDLEGGAERTLAPETGAATGCFLRARTQD